MNRSLRPSLNFTIGLGGTPFTQAGIEDRAVDNFIFDLLSV